MWSCTPIWSTATNWLRKETRGLHDSLFQGPLQTDSMVGGSLCWLYIHTSASVVPHHYHNKLRVFRYFCKPLYYVPGYAAVSYKSSNLLVSIIDIMLFQSLWTKETTHKIVMPGWPGQLLCGVKTYSLLLDGLIQLGWMKVLCFCN